MGGILLRILVTCVSGTVGGAVALSGQASTGTITGRIVAADTGAPVRGAAVTATLVTESGTRVFAVSDAQGRFELAPVRAGAHTIAVVKTGFLPGRYGSRYPIAPGRQVDVAAGRAVNVGDVAIVRAGVISGRVLDEFGEPMVQAPVIVGRQDPATGAFRPFAGPGHTDDLGQYRIAGLPAGSYLVRVAPGLIVALSIGQQVVFNRPGYRATYFPGRASPAEAALVEVRAGEEVSNIDVPLSRVRLFTVAGIAVDAQGRPAKMATLSIANLDPSAGPVLSIGQPTVIEDGSFKRSGLEAGRYSIGVTRLFEGAGDVGFTEVTIGDADLTDIVVTLGPTGTVSGRVELDPPVAGFRMTQLRAVARPTRPDLKSLTPSAMVLNDDGTFSLPGLLGPTTVGLQSLPTGWRMRQVLVGERDLAGQDLQVGPGETIGNVRIVLTNRLGELTGTVTTARGEPVADYTVLVFPADPTGLDGSGSGWPDASGAFRVEHLLPGTYYVVALAAFDPARALEPGFRERLWSSATRVTVSPDSPTRVALKLTALP